jgi:hypothetical protein
MAKDIALIPFLTVGLTVDLTVKKTVARKT